jgi:hypothetical protein
MEEIQCWYPGAQTGRPEANIPYPLPGTSMAVIHGYLSGRILWRAKQPSESLKSRRKCHKHGGGIEKALREPRFLSQPSVPFSLG